MKTYTLKIIPFSVILIAMGAMVFAMFPTAPAPEIYIPASSDSVAAESALTTEDLFVESHGDWNHNADKLGSLANTTWIPYIMSNFGGGDPSKAICMVVKALNKSGALEVIMASVWLPTPLWANTIKDLGTGTPGIYASYHVQNSINPTRGLKWQGSYPKSAEAFNTYQPRKGVGWVVEYIACSDSNFPPMPPGLNPSAQ